MYLLVDNKTSLGGSHAFCAALGSGNAAPQRPYYHKMLMLHVVALPFSHFSAIINQNKHTVLDNKAFIFSTNQTTH